MPLNENDSTSTEKDEKDGFRIDENAEKATNSRKRVPDALSTSDPPSPSEPDKKAKQKIELIVTPPVITCDVESGDYPVEDGQILRKRYQIQKMLGSGAFATVYLAEDTNTKRPVALKIARNGELFNNASDMEFDFMEKAKEASKSIVFSESPTGSDNIVTLIGKFRFKGSHGTHVVLVIESLLSDLYGILWYSNQKVLTLHRVKRFLKNTVEGLYFLHSICKIMHLDLKPENLLVTIDPNNMDLSDPSCSARLKIGDFGTSARTFDVVKRIVQTSHYRAPEAFLKCQITPAADLWSVGCTMYEMATRGVLFPSPEGKKGDHKWYLSRHSELLGPIKRKCFEKNDENGQILKEVFGDQKAFIEKPLSTSLISPDELRKQYPMEKPEAEALCDLMKEFLTIDPRKRLTAEKAMTHSFLSEVCS